MEYDAARFLIALRLPISAALSNHPTEPEGSDSDSRTPRLHMAMASPASAAILRRASADALSTGIPSPTISM